MMLRSSFFSAAAALLLALGSAGAQASGMASLEFFIKNVKTGRASFTQTVAIPAQETRPARTKTSHGTFAFVRPLRFSFVYQQPFAQTIVADGQTLWFFDVDLNQVTARKQASVLSSTPAALIAAATDLQSLQADFAVSEGPAKDGLEWALAVPKSKDSTVQSVAAGFKDQTLVALDIVDSFGQTSRMRFSGWQSNVALDPAQFQFKPPAGADVLRP